MVISFGGCEVQYSSARMMVSTRVVTFGSAGVFGAACHVEGVVIDLEEVGLSLDREGAEVVLAVRVIVLREIAEGLNRQEHAGFGVERQFIDALRHDHLTADERAAEVIVQHPDAVSLREGSGSHRRSPLVRGSADVHVRADGRANINGSEPAAQFEN